MADRVPELLGLPKLLKEEDTVAQELIVGNDEKEEEAVPLMH